MTFKELLNNARNGLIELSFANPLLSYKKPKSRGIQFDVHDPISFLDKIMHSGGQIENLYGSELVTTEVTPDIFSKATKTIADAKLHIEEKGVNVLFLSALHLRWKESTASELLNEAPLLLIPVKLTVKDQIIKVENNEEDVQENFALAEKLKGTLGDLPRLEDGESISEFIQKIKLFCEPHHEWSLNENKIIIDIFKTQKYLIYEDLKHENWVDEDNVSEPLPELLRNAVDQKLFGESIGEITSDEIDKLEPVYDPMLIRDADLTQLQSVLKSRNNSSFIIQGPPGTGKSQTITNLISDSIYLGKKVLFVSEKSTALEVVKDNLADAGLGDLVLDLHDSNSRKTNVLKDIASSIEKLKNYQPEISFPKDEYYELKERIYKIRCSLNTPLQPYKLLPEAILISYGNILETLRLNEVSTSDLNKYLEKKFTNVVEWSHTEFLKKRSILSSYQKLLDGLIGVDIEKLNTISFPPSDLLFDRVKAKQICEELLKLLQCDENQDIEADLEFSKLCNFSSLSKEQLEMLKFLKIWKTGLLDAKETLYQASERLTAFSQKRLEFSKKILPSTWSIKNLDISNDFSNASSGLVNSIFGGGKKFESFAKKYFYPPFTNEKIMPLIRIHKLHEEGISQIKKSLIELTNDQNFSMVVSSLDPLELDLYVQKIIHLVDIFSLHPELRGYLNPKNEDLFCQFIDRLIASSTESGIAAKEVNALFINLSDLFGENGKYVMQMQNSKKTISTIIYLLDKFDDWRDIGQAKAEIYKQNLVDIVQQDFVTPLNLLDYMYYNNLYKKLSTSIPELNELTGGSLETLRARFFELDALRKHDSKQSILLRQQEILLNSLNSHSDGMVLLKREMNKKRNVFSVRKILHNCFEELTSIKPVFMLSPLTVSTFIPKKMRAFDLVIFDEASQVKPSDAIGAVLRAANCIIVGDRKQLPPTRMFDSDYGDDLSYVDPFDKDLDILANPSLKDIESILDFASSLNMPEMRLNWHYRSKFSSLIAVSNKEFYQNDLIVFPDAHAPSENEGLVFTYIPNGNYDRSDTRKNTNEADVIVLEIIKHFNCYPNKSLGVVTFSVAQKEAIEERLFQTEEARRLRDEFNKNHDKEPFFIKNLETVQGDERDCIFISIGYGRSANSISNAISFGPLNQSGGERRLNVLISRAKYLCRVFSSLHYHEIDTESSKNNGVLCLKTFLKYAETGNLDMPIATGADYDSEFERSVANSIKSLGFDVDCQVGSSGFKIDLAVKDPKYPGRYLLGIECDGATYHSSLTARERDRLRQEILESRGWVIHRIWSTDWFRNKDREVEKIKSRILEMIEGEYAI
jgi:superfamily I DNA and/or RNA helicase/very-short-patch-repair endonuclease